MQPVRIDDFARYRYVNSVRVAKDGSRLVYSVIEPDLAQNRYNNDLWALDLATGTQRRLTGTGKEGRFDLMADGSVLFVSGRAKGDAAGTSKPEPLPDDATQAQTVAYVAEKTPAQMVDGPGTGTDLFRLPLDGGEAVLYAHVPLTVRDWRPLPEGKLLVRARELYDAASPYVAAEEIPFWENGGTYMAGQRWGLYVVDPGARDAAGAAIGTADVRRITAANELADSYDLSADGASVYLVSNAFENMMGLTNRIARIDVASGEEELLGIEGLSFSLVRLLDERTLIMLGANPKEHGINTDPQVYLMGIDGSDFRRISHEDFDTDFYNHLVTDARQGGGQVDHVVDGRLLYLHADRDTAPLSAIDAEGNVACLAGGEGSIDSFDTLDAKTLYYVAMRPNLLPEIYCKQGDAPETRLTDFSAVLADAVVTEPEAFDFESNGATLTGYVVKPANYEPGKKYPGILWVHGGPKCCMGNLLIHEIQYLSGLGYFVFYTNPHGSGAHGIEYAASIFGGYGGKDFEDLMEFTDQVLERYPDIDADRLAEMGGSYGGFMTNWIIGHTDRFRCCNSQRSISNWVSMFGVADIGYYFADDQTLGWPWGSTDGVPNVDAMWDQSPLKYADQVKTPTLFLHSDCDYRCPLEQGMQMFTALKIHGVPARLVVFKGENHELSRGGKPQGRVRRLVEISNWYGQWLKDDPSGEPALREE